MLKFTPTNAFRVSLMSGWGRGGSQFSTRGTGRGTSRGRGRGGSRPNSAQNTQQQPITVPMASPLPIIDIGANLNNSRYKRDLNTVLRRSQEANVTRIIITGTSLPNSKEGLELCQNTQNSPVELYCTVGVHPHDAKHCNNDTIETMRRLVTSGGNKVVSIGETGLDFNRNYSPQDVQIEWFDKQVGLACELGLPLFLHEREAHKAFITIMEKHSNGGKLPIDAVVHCFTGTEEEAKVYVNKGYYLGFTGVICQYERGKPLREIITNVVPLERILIETDCPFMLPSNKFRDQYGGRNEPCLLPFVVKTLAECKNVSEEHVARVVTENTLKFFSGIGK
jgi:TatD DNase family protein